MMITHVDLDYASMQWGECGVTLMCPPSGAEPFIAIPELVDKVSTLQSHILYNTYALVHIQLNVHVHVLYIVRVHLYTCTCICKMYMYMYVNCTRNFMCIDTSQKDIYNVCMCIVHVPVHVHLQCTCMHLYMHLYMKTLTCSISTLWYNYDLL